MHNFCLLQVGREESETRTETLNNLKELEEKRDSLTKEIQKYRDSDPEVLAQMKENIKVRLHTMTCLLSTMKTLTLSLSGCTHRRNLREIFIRTFL